MPATNGSRTSLSSQSTATNTRERRDPEHDLPLESSSQRTALAGPGLSPSMAGFRRVHVAHPFGEIEADRKQGQDRDQRHHQCQHRLGVEIEAVRGQHQAGEHDLRRGVELGDRCAA